MRCTTCPGLPLHPARQTTSFSVAIIEPADVPDRRGLEADFPVFAALGTK
jgi:hypothetical protein